jgi:hypothetical protein
MSADDLTIQQAARAFLYGYPLVYCLEEINRFPTGTATLVSGVYPFNHFAHARDLVGPETKFVSPNSDTNYSIAPIDMSAGPQLLHLPDTHGRYYVIQCIDAWTNNFAYLGHRATGTGEATYLLVPWGWKGDLPEGVTAAVDVPTDVAVLVGRFQVHGADDLSAVHTLQDQLTLTPLDGGGSTGNGIPEPSEGVDARLTWWESFRVALTAFPPPDEDADLVAACSALGLTPGTSPFVDPDPALAEVLIAGEQAGREQLEQLMKSAGKPVNGWTSAAHLFDYNRYRLGIGTIDRDDWKIADTTIAYATRAAAARAGLWGNHGYEADYFITFVDEDDQQLSGDHVYELVLPGAPPVDAFWSLTMYDASDFYLVVNPIDRYSIGSATDSLHAAADGTITIRIQHESPGTDLEGNWLPASAGAFRPILRMYAPGSDVLDGTYVLPAIRKLG